MQTELKRLVDKLDAILSKRDGSQKVLLQELFKEFSDCGRPEAITSLLSFLINSDEQLANAAAESVATLFGKISSKQFSQLDEQIRNRSYSTIKFRGNWDAQRQELVPLMRRFEPSAVFMGLASMHHNGHVRELAVGALDLINDGSEIPYLLLRVTDWVPNVSNKAKEALRKRLHAENAGRFLSNIVLVDSLRQRKRGNGAELFQSIHNIAAEAHLSDFLRELESTDRQARRLCLYIALGIKLPVRVEVIKESLKNSDNQVRRIALLSSVANFSKEALLLLLQNALKDSFPSNRKEALRIMLSQFPERSEIELKTALLDRSPSVRAFSRFHVKEKDPQFDFAQFYREHLQGAEQKSIIASLAGLAETGKKELDYEKIEGFLQSPNEQIRKAAINALVVLDKERSVGKLLALMLDESSSVASAARKGLAKCCRFIESEELWRLYSTNKNAKIRYGILKIIASLPKWDRLGYCLLACKSDDENIRKLALEILLAWQQKYGRSWKFTNATTIQKERIKLAAPLVSDIIAGRKFQDLHHVIDSI